MVVEADFDVVFLGEFFESIDGVERLGGDAVEVEFFGDVKKLASGGFVFWDVHHAEVDGGDVVLFQVGDDCFDFIVWEVFAECEVAVFAAEFLAFVNLQASCSGGCCHFDGLEKGEFFKRPALQGNREAGLGEGGGGDWRAIRAKGEQCGGGGDHGEKGAAFHGVW